MLRVTSPAMKILSRATPELGPEVFHMLKNSPGRAPGFIATYQKCMHETVYYRSVFIRPVWNIVGEEEWVEIHKWDRESRLQCHILYCSALHNLSEMKKK